jgi:rubrerythrin
MIFLGKTKDNLKAAFAGESQARNKYTFYAKVARKEGYPRIADIFELAAENEKKHAELILRLLDGIKDTKENLKDAMSGETFEYTDMYPTFLKDAQAEGEDEAAAFFKAVMNAEENHANEFKAALEELEKGTLFKSENEVEWRCRVCGFIHKGQEPPELCPLCKHPREFYDPVCCK